MEVFGAFIFVFMDIVIRLCVTKSNNQFKSIHLNIDSNSIHDCGVLINPFNMYISYLLKMFHNVNLNHDEDLWVLKADNQFGLNILDDLYIDSWQFDYLHLLRIHADMYNDTNIITTKAELSYTHKIHQVQRPNIGWTNQSI